MSMEGGEGEEEGEGGEEGGEKKEVVQPLLRGASVMVKRRR